MEKEREREKERESEREREREREREKERDEERGERGERERDYTTYLLTPYFNIFIASPILSTQGAVVEYRTDPVVGALER